MKRIFLAALLALMLAAPALAGAEQSFSPYDYVTGSAGGGRFLYYDFPDISLYIPASWEGRFTVEPDEFGVAFYHTASYEKFREEGHGDGGGFLFRLCAGEEKDFQDLPAYAYLGYSENANLHFYLTLPPEYTAYQDDPGIMADYDELAKDVEAIAEMARIAPSLSFYTDGLVSTDAGMS